MEKQTMCLVNRVMQPAAHSSASTGLDHEASIHVARNLWVSELPGAAFGLITLIYIFTSLIGLM
ncbi:MAG TPA: hypothetical protein VMB26_13885 [Candidatus Binataceae bacterium]|nr:hypothetical protein [Candidatus Binataceae bacterium]